MTTEVEFDFISPDESWEVFDEAAHRLLDMSGDECTLRVVDGRVPDVGLSEVDMGLEPVQVCPSHKAIRRLDRPRL
jgi:hypothetical protein